MTTDYDRVRDYYSRFDEWARLDSDEGQLEFARASALLRRYLTCPIRVLDLGGGPGRYAAFLAAGGHRVTLADCSPVLLETAREKLQAFVTNRSVESIDEANAVDLSRYADASFDAVVAFGPFYHLLAVGERQQAAREVFRVLRPGGLAFVAFVPRITGVIGLIVRASACPEQVSGAVLREAACTGVFHNAAACGFQEGYYARPDEIERLFEDVGFLAIETVSLRSVPNGCEGVVEHLAPDCRAAVLGIVEDLCHDPAVVATCGHAVHVVRKREA